MAATHSPTVPHCTTSSAKPTTAMDLAQFQHRAMVMMMSHALAPKPNPNAPTQQETALALTVTPSNALSSLALKVTNGVGRFATAASLTAFLKCASSQPQTGTNVNVSVTATSVPEMIAMHHGHSTSELVYVDAMSQQQVAHPQLLNGTKTNASASAQ